MPDTDTIASHNPTTTEEAPPATSTAKLIPDSDAGDATNLAGLTVVGHVVNYNESPSFSSINALLDPAFEVSPGEILGVLHGRGRRVITAIQVGDAFEVNPNESPDLVAARNSLGLERRYGREGLSTRIFRMASCETVEEFDYSDVKGTVQVVGEGRSPQLLARAGDPVVALPPEVVIAAIGGLPSPSDGINVGETYGVNPVPVVLTPLAFQQHMLIGGNPGKGKSYLQGGILEEARAWDIPSLVLDINGENREAIQELGGKVITLPNRDEFGLSLDLITPPELVEITPNVQPGTNYAELIELAHDQLRTEARRPITFNMLRDRIATIGESTKVAKTSVGAAIARVSTLEKDPLVGGSFDFIGQLEKHRILGLDCRFLSLRQTQLIAAMGARELQRVGRDRARAAEEGKAGASDWFAMYFVDEAHAVIPDENVVSTQVFLELARMGRHVRTGLVLSSQSPADLHGSVLKRMQLRVIFALERDQLRSIQGVLADLDEKIIGQLPKLPRGVCAVSGSSDIVRHGFLLKVRERVTTAGGSTPKVFAKRVKRAVERRGQAGGGRD
jgi:DNA helicase HerA-like ATPase